MSNKELPIFTRVADERIAELEKQLAEHEFRWLWLNRSILGISKEGYSEWASLALAVINRCRYEDVQGVIDV